MIQSVAFHNFKVLRDCELPLGRFTLLVGPNGSGKTTVMLALETFAAIRSHDYRKVCSAHRDSSADPVVSVHLSWGAPFEGCESKGVWSKGEAKLLHTKQGRRTDAAQRDKLGGVLQSLRTYNMAAEAIAEPVELEQGIELERNGGKLAGVLDRLRDQEPERFSALSAEFARWLPEFDQILFDTPATGQRAIQLRTARGGHKIPARDISQGTLLALAILTLAYLPEPPSIVCFEEPGRGMHPRLLRDVRDALYRLAYPKSAGESRPPVQVIATTHSPYFLDLFSEHPEEIVICQKLPDNIKFERLSDRDDLEEILGSAHLGDVWYSGVLGGVPEQR